jgi:hypothetical protein
MFVAGLHHLRQKTYMIAATRVWRRLLDIKGLFVSALDTALRATVYSFLLDENIPDLVLDIMGRLVLVYLFSYMVYYFMRSQQLYIR